MYKKLQVSIINNTYTTVIVIIIIIITLEMITRPTRVDKSFPVDFSRCVQTIHVETRETSSHVNTHDVQLKRHVTHPGPLTRRRRHFVVKCSTHTHTYAPIHIIHYV